MSCATYDELEEFVVRRLCKDISGRCVVLETESGSYTVPAFKAWLAADPKLDARVARIITLGLRPWEDQAEREFQHQLKEARKVFRRMTSNVRYSTSG
ncbi:MAG TPA: hypothetical protein VK978_03650 [Candidatus Saccharimonadales bacterium]|nr:hypothetical protein [Candidatus Saccharimonadales bacterium]